MKLAFLFVLLVSFASTAREVTGTVYDDQNVPLPGASVQVKGTPTGTITDFDGNFAIAVEEGQVLSFQYKGLPTKTIEVTR